MVKINSSLTKTGHVMRHTFFFSDCISYLEALPKWCHTSPSKKAPHKVLESPKKKGSRKETNEKQTGIEGISLSKGTGGKNRRKSGKADLDGGTRTQ